MWMRHSQSSNQEWESIFIDEIRKFVFKRHDPHKLSRFLIILLGVPERRIKNRLRSTSKVGPTTIGEYGNVSVTVMCSQIGTIQLEMLIRLIPNTVQRYIIGLGAVGALQENVAIGDLIVPKEAIRGEGLTRYYYPDEVPARPDDELTDLLLHHCYQENARVHTGIVYTTGSLLHETEEMIQEWHNKGYLGVDCEASALFLLSKYCGFRTSLVLYVTDNPYTKKIFSNSYSSIMAVYKAERKAINAILKTIEEVNERENNALS